MRAKQQRHLPTSMMPLGTIIGCYSYTEAHYCTASWLFSLFPTSESSIPKILARFRVMKELRYYIVQIQSNREKGVVCVASFVVVVVHGYFEFSMPKRRMTILKSMVWRK